MLELNRKMSFQGFRAFTYMMTFKSLVQIYANVLSNRGYCLKVGVT